MPLYEYECKCGYEFEELVQDRNIDSSRMKCRKCGSLASRKISSFSSSVLGGSTVEPIDMTIGREAEKRWQNYHDRQSKRHTNLKPIDLPKSANGQYMPVMGLGDKVEKSNRKEYVGALQEHRMERTKRGQGQFDEPGPF